MTAMRIPTCMTLWAAAMLCLVLLSCDGKDAKKSMPKSKGMPSELLVVTGSEVGKSDVMDSINALTDECLPEVLQPEPMFKAMRVSEQHYTRRFATIHTKLLVRLDRTLDKAVMGVARDVYAAPQTEVTVAAPDLDALRTFLSRHKQEVTDALLDSQLRVLATDLRRHHNDHVREEAIAHMGYSICVPKSVCAVKRGQNFLWAGSNLQERDQNVVLYEYPWDGSALDEMTRYVAVRDSVMKANIPGDNPGQWMCTSRMNGQPVIFNRSKRIGGRDYEVVRGMWEVRKAAIGGSFVSMLTIDSVRHTVLAAEGFVYSPSTAKRDLLRQLEASLLTIKKQR